MQDDTVIATLNELLAAEQGSLIPRLMESAVFVSRLEIAADLVIRGTARTVVKDTAELTRLILDLGGEPAPPRFNLATADLHYQDVRHVLPRLLADQLALVRTYTLASPRLAGAPRAAAVVSGILARHQADLEKLQTQSGTNPASRTTA